MRSEALECAVIRRGFMAGGVPAGPEVDAHLRGCAACRELFEADARLGRALAASVPHELELSGLLASVELSVRAERGVRAWLRALPTRLRAWLLVAGALAPWLAQGLWRPRPEIAAASPALFAVLVAGFGVAIVLGALRLARGLSTPLDAWTNERRLTIASFVVPALAAASSALAASRPAAANFGHPERCFAYGLAVGAPLVLLYWLFERRSRPPWLTLALAGAWAGVSANLLLNAHCPSAHPGHLLLGHVSIGAAWALALWLAQRSAQRAR